MGLIRKNDFSVKMVIFDQALLSPFREQKTHWMVMRLKLLNQLNLLWPLTEVFG